MTDGEVSQPPPGRFRLASDHKTSGPWSWKHNPFWGTRPFHALVVANLVLNNWDFKTSNNRIYDEGKHENGAERGRRYVVQDVGAALGKSRWPVGTRDNIDHFESQDLIEKMKDGRVKFDFHARHRFLVNDIPRQDVVWACRLLSRLSDRQWDDAFRSAGYPEDLRRRYIRKIKEKIAQGVALETAPAAAEKRAGSPTRRGSGEEAGARALGG
jgi:hypothetical protein